MICAIIDSQNVVINTIVVDSLDFAPPDGCIAIDVTEGVCGVGFIFDPISGDFLDNRNGI